MALISMSDFEELAQWARNTIDNAKRDFNLAWKRFWSEFMVSVGALFFVTTVVFAIITAALVLFFGFCFKSGKELAGVLHEKIRERSKS